MPKPPRGLCLLVFVLLLGGRPETRSIAWGQRRAEPRIENTQLEPRWAPDGGRFWYRRERPGQTPELILVDAVAGTSAPAFDPVQVAARLKELTGEAVEPTQLPIDGLDFLPDSPDLLLRGPKQSWRLDRSTHSLTAAPPVPPESLPTDLPLRASRRTGAETEIVFRNATSHPIEIFWLEPGGARKSYGPLEPGAERPQHTFAGHRWLATGPEGQPLAVVQATERRGLAIVDGVKLPRETGRPDRGNPPRATPSPDGRWEAFVQTHNLYLRERETGREIPLSVDGSPEASYHRDAIRARAVEMNYDLPDWPETLAEVEWAPDSRHLLAVRTTAVPEPRVTLIESSPQAGGRPVLHTYPYIKPGEPLPRRELRLFDIPAQRAIPIDHSLLDNPWNIDDLHWSKTGDRVWCVYNQRGHQTLRVLAIDAPTGKVTPLVTETSPTFVDYSSKFFLRLLEETGDLLWMSERDGWNHLYRFDLATGELRNQVTRGEWVVRDVERVDVDKRQIWFRAGGNHPGQDPYHVHYGRVNFDGTGLTWLTEGDGTHQVQWSPDRRF
ncbi:MAG: DPP IV N-terminal domain-containing protein, partial [Planctomycetaceae bacterium]